MNAGTIDSFAVASSRSTCSKTVLPPEVGSSQVASDIGRFKVLLSSLYGFSGMSPFCLSTLHSCTFYQLVTMVKRNLRYLLSTLFFERFENGKSE